MRQHPTGSRSSGVSVVEILVVVMIASVALGGLLALLSFSIQTETVRQQELRAQALLQETLEAARSFRAQTEWNVDGLGTLSLATPYHPEQSGSAWNIVAGSETVGIFEREIVFEQVQRDGADNITESGGVVDPDSRRAVVTVSWEERARTHAVEQITILTNW